MTAPTLNEDPDVCFVCRRQPATTTGMCTDCYGRAVWYLNLPPEGKPA